MLDFLKCFSAFFEMLMWVLSFIILVWYITFTDFHMLNQPCVPGINLTWSLCIIFLYAAGNSLLLLCYLSLYKAYWSVIFVSGEVFGFGIRVIVAS